jgi:tyrosine-protein phosphatase YwqE
MIFPFFAQKKEKIKTIRMEVDIHSHLIPNIDDGSKSMEESLELLRRMEALGYKKVITTPHIMLDTYKNTPKCIKEGLASLQEHAKSEGIQLEIEAAAEYYLDEGFYKHLEAGDVMSVQGKYLLFETSYTSKPLQLEEMIFEIGAAGYTPLMAHPERYRYVKDPAKEYGRLKELGVMFQINLNSFGGYYGKQAKELANWLNSEKMIDFLGSDVHHGNQIEMLETVFRTSTYNSIFRNNTILNAELI